MFVHPTLSLSLGQKIESIGPLCLVSMIGEVKDPILEYVVDSKELV